MEKKYLKLKEISGFTVEKVWGYNWQKWDENENKMIREQKYFEGARKIYDIDCKEGKLSVSSNQIGSMLADCMQDGIADLNGKSFEVKNNGKEGMEIRYYINLVRDAKPVRPTEPLGDAAQQFNESQNNDGLPF